MLTTLFAALMVGLLGAGHCISMCGGISGAIAHSSGKNGQPSSFTPLFYNLGRISSYTFIGALAGYTAELGVNFGEGYNAFVILRLVSGVTLIFIGLYIAQLSVGILQLEKMGRYIWRYIQPLTKQFLPLKSPAHAFPLGFLWGWLPCGLVYSALTLALASGTAMEGAMIMFAFGFGTFPIMFLVGNLSGKFNNLIQNSKFKQGSGLILVIFGAHVIYVALTQLGDYSI